MKIGVFDSGIGGTTVLQELRSRFPDQDFLYFGDTANVPYGTKSPAQIRSLAKAASTYLKSQGVDLLVVACNTASCVAMDDIRQVMGDTPVVGVVEAGVATVIRTMGQSVDLPILILGTRATVRSHTYFHLIRSAVSINTLGNSTANANVNVEVHEQECPLLVPMIEEGWVDHPILHQTVAEYVRPYSSVRPGIALLACTHYPWIKAAFQSALGGWKVVDSAWAMGETLAEVVNQQVSASKTQTTSKAQNQGELKWHFTDPESVPQFIFKQLGSN